MIIKTIEQRYPIWNGLTEREQARLEALDDCLRICQRQNGRACYSVLDAAEYEIKQMIGEIVPLDDDDEPLPSPPEASPAEPE